MATIANTSKSVAGPFNPASILLATSGDTLTYVPGTGQELILFNTDVSTVVVTIDGSAGTSVAVPSAGATTLDISAGLAVSVLAGKFEVVRLDSVPAYLQGTVAITAATGAVVAASIIY